MSCSGTSSSFSGCYLRGLPIGIPFTSSFSSGQDESKKDGGTDLFIILPLRMADKFEGFIWDTVSDCNASEEKKSNKQYILNDKGLFSKWNFIPADTNYWSIEPHKLSSCKCAFDNELPTTNDNSDTWQENTLIEEISKETDSINEEFEVSPCVDDKGSRKRRHQGHYDADSSTCSNRKTVKTGANNTQSHSSRQSERLKAVGYRPDYKEMEEGNNRHFTDENMESLRVVDVVVEMLKACEEANLNDDKISDITGYLSKEDTLNNKDIKSEVDGKNCTQLLNKNNSSIYSNKNVMEKVFVRSSKVFDPTENTKDLGIIPESSVFSVGSNSTEFEGSRKKISKRTKFRTSKVKEPKKTVKQATVKKSRVKKRSSHITEDNDEHTPEMEVGEGRNVETVEQTAKSRAKAVKQKEQDDKKVNRIKVKLDDHPDKFRVDIMESFARKDRGKAKEDCETEVLLCTVCEKFRSKNKDIMENHIECHVNGELNCEQCDFIAAFIGELKKHNRLEHKKNVFICSQCGAETSGKEGLKDHMGKVHGDPQWACKHCLAESGKKFACITKTKFRQHMRSDHPDKLMACEACKGLFAHKYHLQKHLNTGCPGDGTKQYPCEICGKTYSTLQLVNNHIARVHNKVRKFQCKLCSFAAVGAPGLAQHLHTHTGYHPFKCDQCTFSCVQRFQLTSHMRTHTGEKPYRCHLCHYAAAWNVQLREHVKVHALPNPLACQRCNIVFKDARGLKSHNGREHSRDMLNPTVTPQNEGAFDTALQGSMC